MIINEAVIQPKDESGPGSSLEIEKFIGNFENLRILNSFPRDGFNPFKHVNIDKLKDITINTPWTLKDTEITSAFVSKSKCHSLKLYGNLINLINSGIQGDPLNYDTMSCPETLKVLTLYHLSNVGILNLLNTIPPTLISLKINDVNLTVDGMKTVISKIEEWKGMNRGCIPLIYCIE